MKKIAWILAPREEKRTFTRGKTAKKRARIWMTVVGIIWLVLYYSILIKVPFYVYMNHLHLPEECTGLETNVIITDLVFGWHIEAERLIYSKQGEKAIEHYIYENNRFLNGIEVRNFYESNAYEYDHDILIPSEKYPYQEQDAENYILLHYDPGLDMFNFMFLLGMVLMLILCRITYRAGLHMHKNNPLHTLQTSLDDTDK